ncbi:4-oxalomesaconate tautomerase [Enterovibrio norvegicus]|uniref:4-oxalomesaconate tautomerase n=1 Tax=Enterovibrio norvegicus TaxID=188144 RepID=A0ABV4L1F4_9GAMM|nr:4-oxalomesaconate tautomerase [Enterovibrio norvegicus]OEF60225.1 PrpF protein [Enterovibrio norvegicus]PMH63190.1 PrpF protein [Enterovibrio norvegicus]
MVSIPYMQLRGGSSKGIYFLASDLPEDVDARDQAILDAVGRDARQIDGLGGANPLTSKVAVVSASSDADCDVDYLFVQVVVGENRVDTTPNCGNILAGVGAFAIESGLVEATHPKTMVRVLMTNSGNRCDLEIETPNGHVKYDGDTAIDGVPGTASPVICHYQDIAGSITGALLPTGNTRDTFEGLDGHYEVTCIDNGMPVVVMRADDFGVTGYENADALNNDADLKARIEAVRLKAGVAMNLGDVTDKVVPKMCLIAPPVEGGNVSSRTFIPHACHSAIGVLGAVSVATACALSGSVAEGIASIPDGLVKTLSVEHPSGEFSMTLTFDPSGAVQSAGLVRTARLLAKGELYLPKKPL